ncbi:MAG: type II toxin-antitoxin system prevent-host-death family antitoxin [Deltaproteobacteria bacterium]|nr:type II toxin-antitoxin system prevent-host-death family antitoxin [Deltaproteobacteria bacterium]
MRITDISEAKAQLAALVEQVLAGHEVVIGKAGKPVAKLVPLERPREPRRLAGKIRIGDDFDSLPDDVAQAFGVKPP